MRHAVILGRYRTRLSGFRLGVARWLWWAGNYGRLPVHRQMETLRVLKKGSTNLFAQTNLVFSRRTKLYKIFAFYYLKTGLSEI